MSEIAKEVDEKFELEAAKLADSIRESKNSELQSKLGMQMIIKSLHPIPDEEETD